MPKFHIHKSIHIAVPIERVHAFVRDFRQWPTWSPWLISEPDCPVEFSADGKHYAWNGKITGSGEMAVTGEKAPHSIDYQLTFLKPWKSVNTARFTFEEKDGGTEVTWAMVGALPFFMFWAGTMIGAFIGADFERGLMLIKDFLETGAVRSRLDFTGPQEFPGCRYIGVRTYCPVADLPTNIRRDMQKLTDWLATSGTTPTGLPFNICHKWDHVKCTTEYIIAFPISSLPATPPTGFVSGEIPACRTYTIRHTGPYRNLGNAWAAGVMRSRAKIFAANNKIDGFEIYQNDPTTVAEDELVTILHFPTR